MNTIPHINYKGRKGINEMVLQFLHILYTHGAEKVNGFKTVGTFFRKVTD